MNTANEKTSYEVKTRGQEILSLRRTHTLKEIAAKYGISVGRVKQIIDRETDRALDEINRVNHNHGIY